MSYAIIGAGALGGALAKQFARGKIKALITHRRGPASVQNELEALAPIVNSVDVTDALDAEVIILAVPFGAIGDVAELRSHWADKIIVDATNAIDFPGFTPMDLGGRPSSQVVAAQFNGAKVVKAFNTLPAPVLAEDPSLRYGHRVIFVSGDHHDANIQIASLVISLGFSPIILGRLAEGGLLQQFRGPLGRHSLIKQH